MRLLFDVGNSRVKWAIVDAGEIRHSGVLPPGAGNRAAIEAGLDGLPAPDSAAAISVAAPGRIDELASVCREAFGLELEVVCTPTEGGGVQVAYHRPVELGTDRWAAMVGALAHGWLPAIVIDCGTAVTIDLLGEDGRHHGGMILPGLGTMRRSLHAGTHGLPAVSDGALPLLADNTADAIRAGTFHGLAAMIGGLEAVIRRAHGEEPATVITGGDAPALRGHLPGHVEFAPQLVLEGLAHYLDMRDAE
ncbi:MULTISPECIES: type III pantothenate kinase [Arhodomonas]|uniref:type III pantothenate kinase n=1 Tax=Arhodomonas TaxID=2368 RepID=UPI00037B00C9|nr:type III pantothenate kinase [Arhodomonas aquaeolei]